MAKCGNCGEDHGALNEVRLPNGKSIGLVGACCGKKVQGLLNKLVNKTGGYVDAEGTQHASPRYTPVEINSLSDLANFLGEGDEVIEFEEERENFGGDENAINKHSVRVYGCAGRRFTLDRTLDGVPPFFTLFEEPQGGTGISRTLKVDGQDYWGDGLSWEKAVPMAVEAIKAHCATTKPHVQKPPRVSYETSMGMP